MIHKFFLRRADGGRDVIEEDTVIREYRSYDAPPQTGDTVTVLYRGTVTRSVGEEIEIADLAPVKIVEVTRGG